jgi:hypothetical protein
LQIGKCGGWQLPIEHSIGKCGGCRQPPQQRPPGYRPSSQFPFTDFQSNSGFLSNKGVQTIARSQVMLDE